MSKRDSLDREALAVTERGQPVDREECSGINDQPAPVSLTVIVEAIRRFFALHGIGSGPIAVAVSGGVDSTALLLALVEMGGVEIVAAHVNHHLRGAESDDDEAYVREDGG